jgi:hypothetical protein
MSDSNQPTPNDRPTAAAPKTDGPLREVLTKLLESANHLSETDTQLSGRIRDLGLTAKDPLQFNDTSVQHQIAATVVDFEKATGRQLDLSAAQRVEVTKLISPGGAPDVSAPQAPPDPIRDVLTKLVATIDQLPASAKDLGTKIRELAKDAQDPVRFNQKSVQHDVAYAAQDFEKATGRQLDLTSAQRTETARLAGSAPGLENGRMIALLGTTPKINDSGIVNEIRRSASAIGHQNNQNTADTLSRIESLENKVRQAARVAEPATEPNAEKTSANASSANTSTGTRSGQGQQNDPAPRGSRAGPSFQNPPPVQTAVLRGGILDTLTAALRGNGNIENAPWTPQTTPFGDRLRSFEARVAGRDQDSVIGRVEKSARAAVEALDGFRNTEGAAVMNRIQSAARAEPGGMASVLSEMREGGRFSDLRQAFNTALNDDKGFTQAYDKAASALARYGEGRQQVEQIIAKRPDAANLTAKFEQLDSQVGERASNTPSRNEGKNMLDDISKTIAEIIQSATEKVRAMFSRTPSAGASPAPAA